MKLPGIRLRIGKKATTNKTAFNQVWTVAAQSSLAVCLLIMISLSGSAGCGEEDQAIVESALDTDDTITSQQGLVELEGPIFTADDLPVATGTRHEFSVNTPGTETPVEFDLEGPWDFDIGVTAATMTTEYIDIDDGPLDDELPEATLVSRYEWENSVAPTEYIYQSLETTSWNIFGRADDDGLTLELANNAHALLLPLSVGYSWQDNYIELDDEIEREIVTTNTVLSFNEISVPAGSYDAFLVQTTVNAGDSGDATSVTVYTWFAPGIGRVAEIVSLADETEAVFDTAESFYRLADFSDAG